MSSTAVLPVYLEGYAAFHSYEEGTGRHTYTMLQGIFARVGSKNLYEHNDAPGRYFTVSEICRTPERALRSLVKVQMEKISSEYHKLGLQKHCLRGFLKGQGIEEPNEMMEQFRPPHPWFGRQPQVREDQIQGLIVYQE